MILLSLLQTLLLGALCGCKTIGRDHGGITDLIEIAPQPLAFKRHNSEYTGIGVLPQPLVFDSQWVPAFGIQQIFDGEKFGIKIAAETFGQIVSWQQKTNGIGSFKLHVLKGLITLGYDTDTSFHIALRSKPIKINWSQKDDVFTSNMKIFRNLSLSISGEGLDLQNKRGNVIYTNDWCELELQSTTSAFEHFKISAALGLNKNEFTNFASIEHDNFHSAAVRGDLTIDVNGFKGFAINLWLGPIGLNIYSNHGEMNVVVPPLNNGYLQITAGFNTKNGVQRHKGVLRLGPAVLEANIDPYKLLNVQARITILGFRGKLIYYPTDESLVFDGSYFIKINDYEYGVQVLWMSTGRQLKLGFIFNNRQFFIPFNNL